MSASIVRRRLRPLVHTPRRQRCRAARRGGPALLHYRVGTAIDALRRQAPGAGRCLAQGLVSLGRCLLGLSSTSLRCSLWAAFSSLPCSCCLIHLLSPCVCMLRRARSYLGPHCIFAPSSRYMPQRSALQSLARVVRFVSRGPAQHQVCVHAHAAPSCKR